MADQAQPARPNPQPLPEIKALRFTGDTDANVLRRIADWESTQEYGIPILLITFEPEWADGESAIVYYEDV